MISAGVDFDCRAIRMSVTSHQPLLSVCIWANLLSLGLSSKKISLMDLHLAYLSTQMVLSLTLRWIRRRRRVDFLSHVYLSAVYWYDIHLSHFESSLFASELGNMHSRLLFLHATKISSSWLSSVIYYSLLIILCRKWVSVWTLIWQRGMGPGLWAAECGDLLALRQSLVEKLPLERSCYYIFINEH